MKALLTDKFPFLIIIQFIDRWLIMPNQILICSSKRKSFLLKYKVKTIIRALTLTINNFMNRGENQLSPFQSHHAIADTSTCDLSNKKLVQSTRLYTSIHKSFIKYRSCYQLFNNHIAMFRFLIFLVFLLWVYLPTFASPYSPVSGFINAKRLYERPCFASPDYLVTVTINFSSNQIPDSISVIQNNRIIVPLLNVEKICNNLFTATYQLKMTNQSCVSLTVLAFIDSTTFFSGTNIKGEKLFQLTYISFDDGGRTYVGIDPPDLLMHGNYVLEKGKDFTFIPFKINTTTGILIYKLFSDTSKIEYPFSVKINPQNGMMNLSQLTDTGIYQLIFTIREEGIIDRRIQRIGFYYITLHIKEKTQGNTITSTTNKLVLSDSANVPYFTTDDNDTLHLNLQFKLNNRPPIPSSEDTHEIFYNPSAYSLLKKSQVVSHDTLYLKLTFLIEPSFSQFVSNPITVEMRANTPEQLCETYATFSLYGKSLSSIGLYQVNKESRETVLYPNPVSDYLHLFDLNNYESIKAIDQLGRTVDLNIDSTHSIDVRHLPPGIFILIMQTNKDTFSTRIVKY